MFERSTVRLVDHLAANDTSPSGHAARGEERASARHALDSLAPADRQILELRYLEDLSFTQIAAKLEVGLSAVKMRHLRALERMRGLLGKSRDGVKTVIEAAGAAGERAAAKADGASPNGSLRSESGSALVGRSMRRLGRRAP